MKLKLELKKVRPVGYSLVVAGVLIGLLGTWLVKNNETVELIIYILAFAIIMSGWIVILIFWRCPHCDRLLPNSGTLGIEHCPFCGNDLGL